MEDHVQLQLGSRTVFWEDIGLPPRIRMGPTLEDRLSKVWDAEVQPWLLEHTKQDWNAHEAGVWFADHRDAIMFKLRWAGIIDISE